MKIEDLRRKTGDELADNLLELKREQFNLRFQKASGQLENTARVREVRRDIARIKQLQGEHVRLMVSDGRKKHSTASGLA